MPSPGETGLPLVNVGRKMLILSQGGRLTEIALGSQPPGANRSIEKRRS
jgi:hypothetical protein